MYEVSLSPSRLAPHFMLLLTANSKRWDRLVETRGGKNEKKRNKSAPISNGEIAAGRWMPLGCFAACRPADGIGNILVSC